MPTRIGAACQAFGDPGKCAAEMLHGEVVLSRVRGLLQRFEELVEFIAIELEGNERAGSPSAVKCLRESSGRVAVCEEPVAFGGGQTDGNSQSGA